jgi:Undecaprenyl-phosphate galactose phosphotransferase WbaP
MDSTSLLSESTMLNGKLIMTDTHLKASASESFNIPKFRVAERRPGITVAVIAATDVLSLGFAWIFPLLVTGALGQPLSMGLGLRALAFIAITAIVFAACGLYPALGLDVLEETKRVILCISFVQLGSIGSLWTRNAIRDQLTWTFCYWAASLVAVPLGRSFVRSILSRESWWGEPVLLIGSGKPLGEIFNLLLRHPRLGLHATGVLSQSGSVTGWAAGLPVLHDLEAGLLFAQRQKIQTAIVALGSAGCISLSEATDRYGVHFPKLIFIPPLSPRFNLCSGPGTLAAFRSIQISQKLLMPSFKMFKRSLDLLIAVSAGMALLPLALVIALAVKLTSPGPVFFGHRRIGRGGVSFRAWKFRTMVSDADTLLAEQLATNQELRMEWERDRKLRSDPRLTPIGSTLRKLSLDELPQLWNVMRSEMSIVGPRPICSAEVSNYAEYFADYSRVLPGITGLWQVSGRNETTYQERVQLDTYYVNNWSPWLDLYIIARTFKAVLSARGAY